MRNCYQRGGNVDASCSDLVSIVIPVFNEEAAIGDDLDTIIATMRDSGYQYEIIVVNDGSTDRTVEIVTERDEVRLISHPDNRGVGAGRTTGVGEARRRERIHQASPGALRLKGASDA